MLVNGAKNISEKPFVMGANHSTNIRSINPVQLEPQLTSICDIKPQFCLAENIQLHLNCGKCRGDDFVVTDAHDERIIYFKCNGHQSINCLLVDLGRKKYLSD